MCSLSFNDLSYSSSSRPNMDTYSYIKTDGSTGSVQAADAGSAIRTAPGISQHSGVQLSTPPPPGQAPPINSTPPVLSSKDMAAGFAQNSASLSQKTTVTTPTTSPGGLGAHRSVVQRLRGRRRGERRNPSNHDRRPYLRLLADVGTRPTGKERTGGKQPEKAGQ